MILDYEAAPDLLADRVILVTGAGGGLGAALCKVLAAHGATVILLGRTVRRLNAVYDEIEAAGGPTPAIYPMDLRGATEHDYDELNATIEREFGRLDGLVHCAALLGTLTPIELFDLQVWSTVLHVNLTAPMLMTRSLLPSLKASGAASVVFCSDRKTRAYWGAYGVAKSGLEGLSKILAHELDDRGAGGVKAGEPAPTVRVNCIQPPPIRTGLRASAYPGELPTSLPDAESVVPAFLYLLGKDGEAVTGEYFDLAEQSLPEPGPTGHAAGKSDGNG